MGGDLRTPCAPPTPVECGVGSEKACAGRWHDAHETVPSFESRPAKKSHRPRRTFSGVTFTCSAARSTSIPSGGAGSARTGLSRSQGASVADAAADAATPAPAPAPRQAASDRAMSARCARGRSTAPSYARSCQEAPPRRACARPAICEGPPGGGPSCVWLSRARYQVSLPVPLECSEQEDLKPEGKPEVL